MRKTSFAIALALGLIAERSSAQGALSLQGLGYPTGQLSARAEGTGGGLADFDPLSLVSPSALAGVGSAAVYFQYSPEFRKVTTPTASANTITARFPVVEGVLPMGDTWTLALSSSTFLDRSFETNRDRPQPVGDSLTDTITITERNKVLGAINDVRLALAWARTPAFRIGVGGHVFTGSNRITFSQDFPDTSIFTGTIQTGRISYTGFAASFGLEFRPSHVLGFALAGRLGGTLRAESGDTVLASGHIPDRFSGSVIYEGISGATLSARVAHDSWSSLAPLSSHGVTAFDGWDTGFGVEMGGPRLASRIFMVRAGARFRTLPFGFNGEKVTENSFMLGMGVPLSRDRAAFDFALQRAARSAGGDIKERGFIFSFGLRVSP
jgi:hypothetical protein